MSNRHLRATVSEPTQPLLLFFLLIKLKPLIPSDAFLSRQIQSAGKFCPPSLPYPYIQHPNSSHHISHPDSGHRHNHSPLSIILAFKLSSPLAPLSLSVCSPHSISKIWVKRTADHVTLLLETPQSQSPSPHKSCTPHLQRHLRLWPLLLQACLAHSLPVTWLPFYSADQQACSTAGLLHLLES